ncbi:MAG: hypothetical protein HOY76_45860 [Streptomyces sp.]|nr:hypothetical protein [Streptomyces sp.]NUS81961.1 hypothetical protein [Streptomyces sp.]
MPTASPCASWTVADGSAVMDSTDAATELEALLAQPGADTLRTLEAMQHACRVRQAQAVERSPSSWV